MAFIYLYEFVVNLFPPINMIAAHQGATFLLEPDNTKSAEDHGQQSMTAVMSSYNKGGSTNISNPTILKDNHTRKGYTAAVKTIWLLKENSQSVIYRKSLFFAIAL
jgi:hypothetical protein